MADHDGESDVLLRHRFEAAIPRPWRPSSPISGNACGEWSTSAWTVAWSAASTREDVLQEAYLAAVGRVKHYDSAAAASPFVWLRMIVLQTLTDLHRHHLGAQMRDADREIGLRGHHGSQSTSVSLAAQLVGRFTSPSQAAAYEETLAKVEQAIATMDPLDQEILAMRHFEELSNSEAAEVLGIQQSTASMRYVRAVKRLRVLLSTMPGFEGLCQCLNLRKVVTRWKF